MRSKRSSGGSIDKAADAEVAGHHPLAGDGFEDAKDLFALAEGVEKDGERADVHGVRAEPDQVRVEARQFGEKNANPDGAFRNFEAAEVFRLPGSSRDCWPCGPR